MRWGAPPSSTWWVRPCRGSPRKAPPAPPRHRPTSTCWSPNGVKCLHHVLPACLPVYLFDYNLAVTVRVSRRLSLSQTESTLQKWTTWSESQLRLTVAFWLAFSVLCSVQPAIWLANALGGRRLVYSGGSGVTTHWGFEVIFLSNNWHRIVALYRLGSLSCQII